MESAFELTRRTVRSPRSPRCKFASIRWTSPRISEGTSVAIRRAVIPT